MPTIPRILGGRRRRDDRWRRCRRPGYASGHPVRAGRRAAPRPHVGAEPLVHAHHESTHVLESYAGHWAVVT
ncbi:MAG: hypothetical protein ACKOTB_18900, partial [Planctomycetia bacterium]